VFQYCSVLAIYASPSCKPHAEVPNSSASTGVVRHGRGGGYVVHVPGQSVSCLIGAGRLFQHSPCLYFTAAAIHGYVPLLYINKLLVQSGDFKLLKVAILFISQLPSISGW
jgi:hypothetical protein